MSPPNRTYDQKTGNNWNVDSTGREDGTRVSDARRFGSPGPKRVTVERSYFGDTKTITET